MIITIINNIIIHPLLLYYFTHEDTSTTMKPYYVIKLLKWSPAWLCSPPPCDLDTVVLVHRGRVGTEFWSHVCSAAVWANAPCGVWGKATLLFMTVLHKYWHFRARLSASHLLMLEGPSAISTAVLTVQAWLLPARFPTRTSFFHLLAWLWNCASLLTL